jgi:hypothetical protein
MWVSRFGKEFPRIRPIPSSSGIVNHPSIRKIYPDRPPRLYNAGGRIFARGSHSISTGSKRISISEYKEGSGAEELVTASMHAKKGTVFIEGLKAIGASRTGLGLFRLLLGEARAYAREVGAGKVQIMPSWSPGEELRKYFESFGGETVGPLGPVVFKA